MNNTRTKAIEKSFLTSYQEYNVVPTRQDISDINSHFRRRRALYQTLGLVPNHLKGKRILEFGPGSGENSIYIASLRPRLYSLVDGTESSIDSLRAIRHKHYPELRVDLIYSDFLKFNSKKKYDAVFCEGAIPTQLHAKQMLLHIASFVQLGGTLVITTMDAVSFLSEAIRRLFARLHIGQATLNLTHLPRLVEFFKKDLDSLKGMSRRREDWVIDQIIHPWNGPLFSIEDAISTLENDFSAHGTSPRFFSDWRWYKSIYHEEDGFSAELLTSYRTVLHNFLDWRFSLPAVDAHLNKNLLDLSQQIYDVQFAMERGLVPMNSKSIVNLLYEILANCSQMHASTRFSIGKAIESLSSPLPPNECDLQGWWGRGQQYLSFIKR